VQGFEVKGAGKEWVKASAQAVGQKVVVRAKSVVSEPHLTFISVPWWLLLWCVWVCVSVFGSYACALVCVCSRAFAFAKHTQIS